MKIFLVFLFSVKKLKSLDCTFLKEKYLNLEKSLKLDNLLDIDRFDLFSKLNILKEIMHVWKMINQLTFLII